MRICIDISQAVYQRGVSRYTQELVSHLLKIDKKNGYLLFGSSLRRRKKLRGFLNTIDDERKAISKFYPIPPTILEFLFNRIHISIDPFIGKVDIFHSSDWTQPKSTAAKITTIHDMIALKFPKLFDQKTISVQKRRLAWVKKEVDKIIAVSENTKKDIVEILQIPPRKIEVIYEAASPAFYPRKEGEIEAVKKKFDVQNDYILTVVTRSSQKFGALLEAFQKVKREHNVKLVVVGEVHLGGGIIQTGFLEDEELARLYSGAAVFVFPSFYEGFGLPVLEALACGASVVCSKTSSLPEVAGEAAVYIDPNSSDSITNGIKKVLMDKKFAQLLSNLGLAQAAKFSWEETAKRTLKLYEEVYSS